jgi:hypothetical protein
MRKLLYLLALALLSPLAALANQNAQGWCEQGNQPVVTSGLTSTTLVQQSVPSCTVTVFIHGGGLATIFSDNSGTPLANPFTASTNGRWIFYAGTGRYDVQLTNASPALNVTYSDIILNDTSSSGTVTSIALTVPLWLTVGGSPVTTSGTLAVTPASAQTSHQVIGTCGLATTFGPCSLVASDLPAIPFSSIAGATNTTAAMLIGTGASLGPTGSGTITATTMPYGGLTSFPAACSSNLFATQIAATPGCTAAVVASSAPANQFATSISAAGALGYTQPSFSNLSGSATVGQLPTSGTWPFAGTISGAVTIPSPGPIGSTTPNTGAFTTLSATGAATMGTLNDVLWVGPGTGQFATIAAAVTAAGSARVLIIIQSTYAGTECPSLTLAQLGALTFWDFRGGTIICPQNSATFASLDASGVNAWERVIHTIGNNTATSLPSGGSPVSLYGEVYLNGLNFNSSQADGGDFDLNFQGTNSGTMTVASGAEFQTALFGTASGNASTGGTITFADGAEGHIQTLAGSTTAITTAAGLLGLGCRGIAGSIPVYCAGVWASRQLGAASSRNYALMSEGVSDFLWDPNVSKGGFDCDDNGGSPRPCLYVDATNRNAATITSWSISANVVTFQAVNTFGIGNVVTINGLTVGTYLNGQALTVLAAGLSGTQFEANFTHANASATETGTAGTQNGALNLQAVSTDGLNLISSNGSVQTNLNSVGFSQLLPQSNGALLGTFGGNGWNGVFSNIRGTQAGNTPIGVVAAPFSSLYLGTAATNNFVFTPPATSGARIINWTDPGGTANLPFTNNTSTTTTQFLTPTATAGLYTSRAFAPSTDCATCVTSAAALTNNVMVKGAGGQGVQTSLITDNATQLNYTGTGGFLSNPASVAGSFSMKQGTTNSTGTTAITDQAPTAVTSYVNTRPTAASNGLVVNVNSSNTVTQTFSGDANHSINLTSQTAAKTTTTLCAATANTACGQAGMYMVRWNFWGSGTACSSVTAGSVTFLLTWTDENGQTHSAVPLGMFDQKSGAFGTAFNFNTTLATESAGGGFEFSTNGTIIQYATGYTACTTGTGTYNLRATVVQLQ